MSSIETILKEFAPGADAGLVKIISALFQSSIQIADCLRHAGKRADFFVPLNHHQRRVCLRVLIYYGKICSAYIFQKLWLFFIFFWKKQNSCSHSMMPCVTRTLTDPDAKNGMSNLSGDEQLEVVRTVIFRNTRKDTLSALTHPQPSAADHAGADEHTHECPPLGCAVLSKFCWRALSRWRCTLKDVATDKIVFQLLKETGACAIVSKNTTPPVFGPQLGTRGPDRGASPRITGSAAPSQGHLEVALCYFPFMLTCAIPMWRHTLKACSEETPTEVSLAEGGMYSVGFDPLDGSSVIGMNFAVGSIFGIWKGKGLMNRYGMCLSLSVCLTLCLSVCLIIMQLPAW